MVEKSHAGEGPSRIYDGPSEAPLHVSSHQNHEVTMPQGTVLDTSPHTAESTECTGEAPSNGNITKGLGVEPTILSHSNTPNPDPIVIMGLHDIHNSIDESVLCHNIENGLPYDGLWSYEQINKVMHSTGSAYDPAWYPRPFVSHLAPESTVKIYEATINAKNINSKGARRVIPSGLNIDHWATLSTGHSDDQTVLDGVRYGFPLQYKGGPIYREGPPVPNHHSARYHGDAIDKYIATEIRHGTLVGPFKEPPFTPWAHVSPLMTRPKSDSADRRIIVDLSYPDGGVNRYINKHQVGDEFVSHMLPTVHQALDVVRDKGIENTLLASVDISRAYRNFRTCPTDWPLLNIYHNGEYFIDTAMPFGSRLSSYYMTKIAEFIARALQTRGVEALIYLDDILIIGKDEQSTKEAYGLTLSMLRQLGLPIATHKLIPPTRKLVWLGVCIDLDDNSISIPHKKLEEIRTLIVETADMEVIPYKRLQSLIGAINHLSKTTPPARLFMARMLQALRDAAGGPVKVGESMLADINWFKIYLRDFNGRAIIPDNIPAMIIEADACLSGLGGHNGHEYYTIPVTEKMADSYSISRLECLNCLLAARTFIRHEHTGKTVLIRCDNESTVFTYQNGKARDLVMQACARGMWIISATLQVNIIVVHIPGVDLCVADALSREFINTSSSKKAERFVNEMNLSRVLARYSDLDYSDFL